LGYISEAESVAVSSTTFM